MKFKTAKRFMILGMVSCMLMGCGNAIPELTEEEASLIATYAADVVLGSSRESSSRLIDTTAETARLEELSEKVEQLKEKKALEEEEEEEKAGTASADATVAAMQQVENIAGFIGLDAFQVSYGGYEIKKSYAADEAEEWEPTFDANSGENLLVVKLKVTNITDTPAVADVLSKNVMFFIGADNNIGGMAYVTMLLNDFSTAADEIGAGESKQYVLITQIDENITEVNSLSLRMKKGEERANIMLQ